jgi:hypothetical protein
MKIKLAGLLLLAGWLAAGSTFAGNPSKSPKQDENTRSRIARADLNYEKPAARSEEGMPVGNGRMGTLVWTTPSSLKCQINRVDIFGNNAASNNFYVRHTDYCGGAAFVDLTFVDWGADVFSDKNFKQHLSCYDGLVATEGDGIKTETLVWQEKDVMAIRVDDRRSSPQAISAALRMLRLPLVKTGDHKAVSEVKTLGDKIVLTQVFEEGSYYCSSAVVLAISGRNVKPVLGKETEVKLVAQPGGGSFTIYVSSAASFNRNEDVVKLAISQADDGIAKGFDAIHQDNLAWWKGFWDKGYVHMHSKDGVADLIEDNYTYFLYVMASSSRGKLPPKFNGMLWSTGGDARKWGNLFWGANQSCLYNGLFPTNRMELLDPLFSMYTGMYPSLEKAARQQWGSKGIYIPETVGFDGLPDMPENIASEMRDLYLVRKPWSQKSDSFFRYAATQMPFFSRWNWKKDEGWKEGRWCYSDKGGGTFGHVTHIFSRGAKIAYQYWQRYEFTRDETWLRDRAYPMLKGMAEFYRNFPNVRKEKDGKYHIFNVNDNESVWGGHNTVEEISSMMGIFPAAIRASEILNTDADLRPLWKEFIQNLSPLPLSTDYPELAKSGKPTVFARSLLPIVQGNGSNRPDPNTMPVWFFDLCNLNGDHAELTKIAQTTFDGYFPAGINAATSIYVLSKLPATGALMGRKEATKYLIPGQIFTKEAEVMPNRMDLREGYQTASVQRLGRATDALHNALCQSAPPWPGKEPVIRIFPAWPEEWDADFKLLCRGNFVVTASFKNGKTETVEILSQSGSPCNLENPWPGKRLSISYNGKPAGQLSGNVLKFKTKKEDIVKIMPIIQ